MPSRLLAAAVAVGALGCGGSSSETPFPQSPREVAAIPVLQRSRPKPPNGQQGPGGLPGPAPTSQPPPPEE